VNTVTTLVLCVDRTNDVGRKTGLQTPVAGWEAVRSLVIDVGLADPEDSGVNSLLEALRVTRDLRENRDEEAIVAVVSGASESMVGADRAVARQLDELIAQHDPDSAVVVIDSAEDERLVPIVESRLRVDSVDRVVVRQARDLESTYYLLKQFLADEELRQTVLVPIGLALLAFPALTLVTGVAQAMATITAVIGLFLLYKGIGIDDALRHAAGQVRDSLYSGQVSVVTYVVAAGLTLVGLFAGALGVSDLASDDVFLSAMRFAYDSVAWLALAALAASTGRLLDEMIRNDRVRPSYLNLPFVVVGIGLVVRGFAGYFLERAGVIPPFQVPVVELGVVRIEDFSLALGNRLGAFVVTGVLVSLIGIRVATWLSGSAIDEAEADLPEADDAAQRDPES
jgi:putative membrane protein